MDANWTWTCTCQYDGGLERPPLQTCHEEAEHGESSVLSPVVKYADVPTYPEHNADARSCDNMSRHVYVHVLCVTQ